MNKGNRYKNNRKKTNKKKKIIIKQISLILLIVFTILFIISGIKIIQYLKSSKNNNMIIEDISKTIKKQEIENNNNYEYNIDFSTLKEKNSDAVGFIKVNGTNIENVVVKSKDNNYYLNHNFEKKTNNAGWIFADYNNKLDGSDKNIVIYGHNMRNNSMFGTLKNVLDESWKNNEDNRKITFITEKEKATYEVFSVYQVEAQDYYLNTNFSDTSFNSFLKTIKERSKYNFNVDITNTEQILTLSTCANNNKYRIVLHARKIIE